MNTPHDDSNRSNNKLNSQLIDQEIDVRRLLDHVRHFLPAYGPIKDFVHHNPLVSFQHLPFKEAVIAAERFYGGQAYMSLDFFRAAFKNGKIPEHELNSAIKRSRFARFLDDEQVFSAIKNFELVKETLLHLPDIVDPRTFPYAAKQHNLKHAQLLEMTSLLSLMVGEKAMPHKIRALLKQQFDQDIDALINPVLFRFISNYLDQGVALWSPPHSNVSFFECIRGLVADSNLPIAPFINRKDFSFWLELGAEKTVRELLHRIVGNPANYEAYISETLMAHPGWSGMVCIVEAKPASLLNRRRMHLMDFLAMKLMLEWAAINHLSKEFIPLASVISAGGEFGPKATDHLPYTLSYLFSLIGLDKTQLAALTPEQKEALALFANQAHAPALQEIWQDAFEFTYYNEILRGFSASNAPIHTPRSESTSVQAIFCIDDKECSLRRYIEELDSSIETFAWAGFFGIDWYFQPLNSAVPEQFCPVILTPTHIVKERVAKGHEKEYEKQKEQRKKEALASQRMNDASSSILRGFFAANTLGHMSLAKLALCLLKPRALIETLKTKKIDVPTELSLLKDDDSGGENLQYGYSHEEMALRVFTVLNNMGLTENFAPIVAAIAHGSSTVNNPHSASYDCGACSGRPGAPNARAFAAMANTPEVRALVEEKGIHIPNDTLFVAGLHDTCKDTVSFFDLHDVSAKNAEAIEQLQHTLNTACERNAKERCRRFISASLNISPKKAHQEVEKRAYALFEPRPELSHATNALCVVGRRTRTKGLFLDRRAFMNSYDPTKDPEGKILNQILGAAIPVCGGINLEYYFSRTDPGVYGCGTKLSHNVCGLLGVYNGTHDDLRTGLPVQMTEVHDPVRLLMVIEQKPDIVESVLKSNANLKQWTYNKWIHVAALDPDSKTIWMLDEQGNFAKRLYDDAPLAVYPTWADIIKNSRDNIPIARINL
jgi:uncharacterized protein YbcC (UPF0753/DUF2309 family)